VTGTTICRAIEAARGCRPTTRRDLWSWIRSFTGIKVPHEAVCIDHSSPYDLFARQVFERPALALWHGPRGSGKSFLSALETHLVSRFNPGHETRILGGSLTQAEQIHRAISEAVVMGQGPHGQSDAESIANVLKTEVRYCNGSVVALLAASRTAVRGPHVPSLKLDEVDEIDSDIRESAIGMAMDMGCHRSSVLMTSTWHRTTGPMAELVERGRAGAFPVDTFCIFEVLERCPEERSGRELEKCPECPLVDWCHGDRDLHPSGLPKAKRSCGHYSIENLAQKAKGVSLRVFESDYLCLRPKAAGVWFITFNEREHIRVSAEYMPDLPVHVAVDPGVHTGAIWFQVRQRLDGLGVKVNVFADYFAEAVSAEANARAIMLRSWELCGSATARQRVSIDPAGTHRTAVGPTVRGEYQRAGLQGRNGLESWPVGRKADGLQLVEALLRSADGTVNLTIHPRCRHLRDALTSYVRARAGNQWLDCPRDPQHPHEDMIDPLCGGLKLELPESRMPAAKLRDVCARGLL
jgi:hypothetical protein